MSEIKLTSTYYLQEVISALVNEGYTLEVKRGRTEDETIIRWASADHKTEQTERSEEMDKEKVTYCMIYECEDCPKYGDDCDGRDEEE